MTEQNERELVQACLAGNNDAQRALYTRFKGRMFAVCLRYANDRTHAEDLLQDGFIRVFTDLHQFRFEGSFEGWIRRVILHVIFRDLRRNKNSQLTTWQEDDKFVVSAVDEDDDFRQRTAKELIEMMQQLAPGFRAVLNMYVLEGYNHREIGEILGISENTSKSQYLRAKVALRELYEKRLS